MSINGVVNSEEFVDFLSGKAFSEMTRFHFRFKSPTQHRIEAIEQLVRGKSVLHIGCCDHVPAIPDRVASGLWMHSRLTKIASNCLGVDIDAGAVAVAKEESGLTNLIVADIANGEPVVSVADQEWDYAVFGDVLEHIGDPVSFIGNFLKTYGAQIDKVIISVPNGLNAGNIRGVLSSSENNNTDHRFWFTPFTLSKIAYDSGLMPLSIQMASFESLGLLKGLLYRIFPMLASTIILVGRQRRE